MNQDISPKPELRSEELEDILGRMPAWLTRNGIVLLFLVVILLIVGAWLYQIPDIKSAGISVTSIQAPADIEARKSGIIERLLVADNENVEAGKVLAVVANPADFEDVVGLKKELTGLHIPTIELPQLKLPVNGNADLGRIQPEYAAFYKSYRDYEEFIQLDYHQRKVELLHVELEQLKAFSSQLIKRSEILSEDLQLAQKQFQRDSSLYSGYIVSEATYEDSKGVMLSKRDKWQEIEGLKTENDILIARLESDTLEMELRKQEQNSMLSIALEESFNSLKASISTWEKDYLLIAPINGQVTFNLFWSENQNVKEGEKVMTIIPEESGALVGKILLPMRGAGEVRPGQQVNIKFDNYPYLEYGMVKGIVENISKVPVDNFYSVEVVLPDGLNTYYGYRIDFSQNMQGNAEILTDKMRLLQRIFNPVRNAMSRQRAMS